MGSNSAQAWGFLIFLVAFVLIAMGMGPGASVLATAAGLVLLVTSLAVLKRAKAAERIEE